MTDPTPPELPPDEDRAPPQDRRPLRSGQRAPPRPPTAAAAGGGGGGSENDRRKLFAVIAFLVALAGLVALAFKALPTPGLSVPPSIFLDHCTKFQADWTDLVIAGNIGPDQSSSVLVYSFTKLEKKEQKKVFVMLPEDRYAPAVVHAKNPSVTFNLNIRSNNFSFDDHFNFNTWTKEDKISFLRKHHAREDQRSPNLPDSELAKNCFKLYFLMRLEYKDKLDSLRAAKITRPTRSTKITQPLYLEAVSNADKDPKSKKHFDIYTTLIQSPPKSMSHVPADRVRPVGNYPNDCRDLACRERCFDSTDVGDFVEVHQGVPDGEKSRSMWLPSIGTDGPMMVTRLGTVESINESTGEICGTSKYIDLHEVDREVHWCRRRGQFWRVNPSEDDKYFKNGGDDYADSTEPLMPSQAKSLSAKLGSNSETKDAIKLHMYRIRQALKIKDLVFPMFDDDLPEGLLALLKESCTDEQKAAARETLKAEPLFANFVQRCDDPGVAVLRKLRLSSEQEALSTQLLKTVARVEKGTKGRNFDTDIRFWTRCQEDPVLRPALDKFLAVMRDMEDAVASDALPSNYQISSLHPDNRQFANGLSSYSNLFDDDTYWNLFAWLCHYHDLSAEKVKDLIESFTTEGESKANVLESVARSAYRLLALNCKFRNQHICRQAGCFFGKLTHLYGSNWVERNDQALENAISSRANDRMTENLFGKTKDGSHMARFAVHSRKADGTWVVVFDTETDIIWKYKGNGSKRTTQPFAVRSKNGQCVVDDNPIDMFDQTEFILWKYGFKPDGTKGDIDKIMSFTQRWVRWGFWCSLTETSNMSVRLFAHGHAWIITFYPKSKCCGAEEAGGKWEEGCLGLVPGTDTPVSRFKY